MHAAPPRAGHGISAHARSGLAGVQLGAGVTVVARRAAHRRRVSRDAREADVVDAGVVIVDSDAVVAARPAVDDDDDDDAPALAPAPPDDDDASALPPAPPAFDEEELPPPPPGPHPRRPRLPAPMPNPKDAAVDRRKMREKLAISLPRRIADNLRPNRSRARRIIASPESGSSLRRAGDHVLRPVARHLRDHPLAGEGD